MKKLLCSLMAVLMAVALSSCSFGLDLGGLELDDEQVEPVRLGIMRFASKTYDVPDGMAAVIGEFFGRMLFKSKGIALLERDRLDEIGAELNLGMSGLVSDATAAKVGKIAGCQYMLLGSITNLARGASGMAIPTFGIPVGFGSAKQKVKAALDVRVVDVETGRIVFADSAEGEASKSDSGVTFYGIDFVDSEFGGIENVAIAQAASKLAPQIEKALTGKDTLSEILNSNPKKANKAAKTKTSKAKAAAKPKTQEPEETGTLTAASVQDSAVSAKPNFENKSTDPAKVVKSYGLSSGEANSLRIKHINASKLGNTKKAYNEYVKMAEENSLDYLAAFRAGEIAQKLRKKDDARTWLEKALEINPDYEPAQKALAKL